MLDYNENMQVSLNIWGSFKRKHGFIVDSTSVFNT